MGTIAGQKEPAITGGNARDYEIGASMPLFLSRDFTPWTLLIFETKRWLATRNKKVEIHPNFLPIVD